LDDLGCWLQRGRVHTNDGKELTQVRHRDGERSEVTDMMSEVELD